MTKILHCYPFSDKRVRLVEGFASYDGVIGDEPGAPHKGIDFVLQIDGSCQIFDVHAAHDGIAFRGYSESWGSFVTIHATVGRNRYTTIYAHLADIDSSIAPQVVEQGGTKIRNEQGTEVFASQRLGAAGASGLTHGIEQLHFELHEKDLAADTSRKLDPYGLYDRASSERYPQPGYSLAGLDHCWLSDHPSFA